VSPSPAAFAPPIKTALAGHTSYKRGGALLVTGAGIVLKAFVILRNQEIATR
jgi:hypothetical protein